MIKRFFILFISFFILIFSNTVSADFVWTEKSFGGKAETYTYEWSEWSDYWKIGYTSKYDVTRNMLVNVLDISAVAFHYSEEGDPGWLPQDVNEDGEISIEDLVQVSLHYGENYN